MDVRITQHQLMDENFPLIEPAIGGESESSSGWQSSLNGKKNVEPMEESDGTIESDELEIENDKIKDEFSCGISIPIEKTTKLYKIQRPMVIEKPRLQVSSSKKPLTIPSACMPKKGGARIYCCNHCPAATYSLDLFVQHYQNHGAEKRFRCAFCNFSVDLLRGIRRHEKIHSNPNKSVLLQLEDDEVSPPVNGNVAKEETIDVVDDAPGSNAQEKPQNSLSSTGPSLNRYVKPASRKERQGQYPKFNRCHLCPFKARSQRDLESHNKGHERTSGASCPHCTFRSTSYGFIKMHIRMHTETERPKTSTKRSRKPKRQFRKIEAHTCVQCPYSAVRMDALVRHKKLHGCAKRKSLQCSGCSFAAVSRPELSAHVRGHFPSRSSQEYRARPLHCSVCGLWFKLAGHRIAHRLVLHRVREKSRKICPPLLKRIRTISLTKITSPVTSPEKMYSGVKKGRPAVKKFNCPHCPYQTTHRKQLLKHMENHRVKWKFRCHQCSFSCKTKASFSFHKRLHVKEPQVDSNPSFVPSETKKSKRIRAVFTCNLCPHRCNFKWDLAEHELHHEGDRRYKCKHCSYNCERMNALSAHEQLHCAPQIASTANEQSFPAANRTHLAIFDDSEVAERLEVIAEERPTPIRSAAESVTKPVSCDLCPYTCKLMCHLVNHQRLHGADLEFKCPHCTYACKHRSKLSAHKKLHLKESGGDGKLRRQPTPKTYVCKECPYTTGIYPSYYAHLKTHKGTGKFKCDQCTFSTGATNSLRRHQKLHDEQEPESQTYKCSDCDYIGHSYGSLWWHKKRHTASREQPEKPKRAVKRPRTSSDSIKMGEEDPDSGVAEPSECKFDCDLCPHRAHSVQLLEMHRKLHVGRRPYQCPHCCFSVAHSDTLQEHLKLHGFSSGNKQKRRGLCQLRPTSEGSSWRRKRLCCPYCPFRTHSSQLMVQHQETHVALASQTKNLDRKLAAGLIHYCPKCSFECENVNILSKHLEMHGRRPDTYMCCVCDYSAKHDNIVRFHEQNHHTHVPFSVLGSKIISNQNTEEEEKSSEINLAPKTGEVALSCVLCPFESSLGSDLKTHWMKEHQTITDKNSFALALNLMPKTKQ